MEKNNILTILVIILIIISIGSPIFFYYNLILQKIDRATTSSAVGEISFFVLPTCGGFGCEVPYENCTSCESDCGECIEICGDAICSGSETCSLCPEDCGICSTSTGGGGGGGGGSRTRINFMFSPDLIQEKLYQGDSVSQNVDVINIGTQDISVALSLVNLDKFVFLDKNIVNLDVDETGQFKSTISVSELEKSGVYMGNIVGTAENVQKNLPVVITVRERESPIFIEVSIPEESQVILPSETVFADIIIKNKLQETIDATLENSVRDKAENILLVNDGSINLDPGENIFNDEFQMPTDTLPGFYFVYVNLTYDGKSYQDIAPFKVESRVEEVTFFIMDYLTYLWIVLAVIILISIILLIRHLVKHKVIIKKTNRKKSDGVDETELISSFISKLNKIKLKGKTKYDYNLLEEYFRLMRIFFSKYYSVRSSLTFEELISVLEKRRIKKSGNIVTFINRIAHIPYYYTLMPKDKFLKLIDETIILINGLRINKKGKNKKLKKAKQ